MKLAYDPFQKLLEFKENIVNVIAIENPKALQQLIIALIQQIENDEGLFTLSENGETLKISKEIDFIVEPFDFSLNQKKVINHLYKRLQKQALDEKNYVQSTELNSILQKYMMSLLEDEKLNLIFEDEIDYVGLFKLMGVKIDEGYVSFLDHLIDYMQVMQDVFNIRIMAFLGLHMFMPKEELIELYRSAAYMKMQLVLIEGTAYDKISDNESLFVVDNDLCEIGQ